MKNLTTSLILLGGFLAAISLLLQGCVTYPVVGCSDEYNEVLKGTVNGNLLTGTSRIEVEGINSKIKGKGSSWITYIPPTLSCEGQKGEALLTFDDGRVIRAEFVGLSCSSGWGYGKDQNGNKFTFTFGMTDNEAQEYIEKTRKAVADRPDLPSVQSEGIPSHKKSGGSGTGFFVSSDGYLVTSFHVVEGTSQITVRDANGSEYPAKLVKSDPKNDVALLKVQCAANPIPVVPYANVSKGDEVFTIGYPLPELQGQEQKATFGRVNALSGIKDDIRFIQVDVPVQPGNSGGPLIDRNGRVVGMVTHILAQVETLIVSGTLPQNVNYALKSDYIMPVIRPYVSPNILQEKQDTAKNQISETVKKTEASVVLVLANEQKQQESPNWLSYSPPKSQKEEPQFIGVCAQCGRHIGKNEKVCMSGSKLLCPECFKKMSENR